MKTLLCLLLTLGGSLTLSAQDPSPFLLLDQFGYLPLAEKVAVLSDPQSGQNAGLNFTPGATLEIRRATDDGIAWSGTTEIWNNGATHAISGDKGWWLDFTDLTTPGDYYLIDPASGEQTGTFTIGDDVYDSVLQDAGRMFFYNRCGAPKTPPSPKPAGPMA